MCNFFTLARSLFSALVDFICCRANNNDDENTPLLPGITSESDLSIRVQPSEFLKEPRTYFPKPGDKVVLLLGETGVGKSTFVNSILNYLKWSTIEEASKHETQIVIPTHVSQFDDDYKELETLYFPHNVDKHVVYDETVNKGQSLTQKASHYIMEYAPDKRLVLIDTAGIGDTRGIEYDKQNLLQLKRYLKKENIRQLDGICILLHPNYKRLTDGLKYTLHSTIDFFGPSSNNNIFFCFTRTSGTSYKPGDTLSTLRTLLLKKNTHKNKLKTSVDNIFCFENSCFRQKLLLEHSDTKELIGNTSQNWKFSAENMRKLLKAIEVQNSYSIPAEWFTMT